jgi:hypothetical protein
VAYLGEKKAAKLPQLQEASFGKCVKQLAAVTKEIAAAELRAVEPDAAVEAAPAVVIPPRVRACFHHACYVARAAAVAVAPLRNHHRNSGSCRRGSRTGVLQYNRKQRPAALAIDVQRLRSVAPQAATQNAVAYVKLLDAFNKLGGDSQLPASALPTSEEQRARRSAVVDKLVKQIVRMERRMKARQHTFSRALRRLRA